MFIGRWNTPQGLIAAYLSPNTVLIDEIPQNSMDFTCKLSGLNPGVESFVTHLMLFYAVCLGIFIEVLISHETLHLWFVYKMSSFHT